MKGSIYFSIVTCMALTSATSWSAIDDDWTPFFKSWENGCDMGDQKVLLKSLTPNYESIYSQSNSSTARLPFTTGYISLPLQYQILVDGELKTEFYDNKGESTAYLTEDSSFFNANFEVVGSYYGMPMKKIGFEGGIANGIYAPYFILDTPLDQVRRVVRAKANIVNESCDACDLDEYGESSIGMAFYKFHKDPDMTYVVCSLSN